MRRVGAGTAGLVTVLAVAGCALGVAPLCQLAPASGDVVYLVDHGWHTDIGVPVAELSGRLQGFRAIFAGANSVLFGFGKRTFMTARADRWEEYLVGPFPGPGAMLVAGLSVSPEQAYGARSTVVLRLPEGGAQALSRFLMDAFASDGAGRVRPIGPGPWRGSLFYAAAENYTIGNTCNDWSVRALRAAGVPITAQGVLLAAQAMHRARVAAGCPLATPGATVGMVSAGSG